jgi:hypothetical protein
MTPVSEGKTNKRKGGSLTDIYTALLGLATLVTAATAAITCIYGYQLHGVIFTVSKISIP